jgi:hypothetical protein
MRNMKYKLAVWYLILSEVLDLIKARENMMKWNLYKVWRDKSVGIGCNQIIEKLAIHIGKSAFLRPLPKHNSATAYSHSIRKLGISQRLTKRNVMGCNYIAI